MSDIVYIDDEPEEFLSQADAIRARVKYVKFQKSENLNEAFEVAKDAALWLFDFYLIDPDHGDYRDENGLSLFQKWKTAMGGRPTTVVVSNALERALGEPPGRIERRHVIAQKHGVEWLGSKGADTADRIKQLADASIIIGKSLDLSFSGTGKAGVVDLRNLCFAVLRAPESEGWAESAMRQIDRARPPREVSTPSDTLKAQAVIGWLLAHVLPYPSFLLTDRQAALRLQITPDSFRTLVETVGGTNVRGGEYQGKFLASRYDGPLSSFLGPRWWRAGIDDFAWHLSQDSAGFRPALEALVETGALTWLDQSEPVLVSGTDLIETDEIAEASDCVRVTDEDFPAGVDPVWVRIVEARSDRKLAAKVVYEDRELLDDQQ